MLACQLAAIAARTFRPVNVFSVLPSIAELPTTSRHTLRMKAPMAGAAGQVAFCASSTSKVRRGPDGACSRGTVLVVPAMHKGALLL